MLTIKVLKAQKGDCIIISFGTNIMHHILIDGGEGKLCFRDLLKFIKNVKNRELEKIDALVLTHIDYDHIDGILRLLSEKDFDFSIIDQIWFNFGKELNVSLNVDNEYKNVFLYDDKVKISWNQGISLDERLNTTKILRNSFVKKGDVFNIGDAKISIIAPTRNALIELIKTEIENSKQTAKISQRNDYDKGIKELKEKEFEGAVTVTNRSSIAFIFEYNGYKLLLLGDSPSDTIEQSLLDLGYSKENKLKVDFCKISHHASKHNTSNELIQMLDCNKFIISSQVTSGRPSKECLSRIICNTVGTVYFYCNYNIYPENIFSKQELLDYGMVFIEVDEHGIKVEDNCI